MGVHTRQIKVGFESFVLVSRAADSYGDKYVMTYVMRFSEVEAVRSSVKQKCIGIALIKKSGFHP